MRASVRRLFLFTLAAAAFEVIALLVARLTGIRYVVYLIIALWIVYVVMLAVRGWTRQSRLDLPPSMSGRVVRKRHWRLF